MRFGLGDEGNLELTVDFEILVKNGPGNLLTDAISAEVKQRGGEGRGAKYDRKPAFLSTKKVKKERTKEPVHHCFRAARVCVWKIQNEWVLTLLDLLPATLKWRVLFLLTSWQTAPRPGGRRIAKLLT